MNDKNVCRGAIKTGTSSGHITNRNTDSGFDRTQNSGFESYTTASHNELESSGGQFNLAPNTQPSVSEDHSQIKDHNEILVRKLEEKAAQLEHANRELAAREAHLRAIFDTEPECVKLLAADGALLEMNPAGLRMIEADSFQQVGSHCVFPLIVEEHRKLFEDLTTKIFSGGSGTLEFQIVGLKGGRRWLETHASPLRDESGKITALLGITRDITERKHNETMLRCQKQVLELITLGAPLPEILASLVRGIEAHSAEMLCTILLLDSDGVHLHHGAAPSLPEEFTRAIDGQPIGARAGSCGTAAFRRTPVIVEDIATDPLWENYRAVALPHGLRACWSTPIFDAQQRVLGTFAIYYRKPGSPTALHRQCIDQATDMAAIAINHTGAETALRLSESRHRRLLESNIIGVMIADIHGGISEANDLFLRMVGYTCEELKAGLVRWDTMTPPEWRAVDEHIVRELKTSGVCQPVEKEYVRKDGTRLPILASVAMLEGTTGDAICLIADMTERKQAEQKIRTQLDELRRWQSVTMGRENRVLELKREVNELHKRLGEPVQYATQTFEKDAGQL